jgi:hypothetical protein
MVVFEPEFWLQSSSTLLVRSAFFMSLTMRSGCMASSERASVCATSLACSLVTVPSSRAYMWMPFDPLVSGTGCRPMSSSSSRTHSATRAQSSRSAPSPGSRSSTSRSGFCRSPSSIRHCGTCSSSAPICVIQASAAGSDSTGYCFGPVECCSSTVWIQSGAPRSSVFWKNTWPGFCSVPTPSTQRLRVTGRPPAWAMRGSDARSTYSSTSRFVVPVDG